MVRVVQLAPGAGCFSRIKRAAVNFLKLNYKEISTQQMRSLPDWMQYSNIKDMIILRGFPSASQENQLMALQF